MIYTMVEYKDRLTRAMDESGVDVTAMAKALGVSYQAVRKVCDGLTKYLQVPNHFAAADHLGVSPRWLATGDGPMRGGGERVALEAALAEVLAALGGVSPGQLNMIVARLRDMPGHPEMRDDVSGDVLPILAAGTANRLAA